ncbi:MAG TPA: hypothetical protein DCL72_00560 [Rhizobiales bacterium]|nr:hypothetical protein [Hyphomicrobiales bacterium]
MPLRAPRAADNSHCGANVRDPAILSLLARRRNFGRHDATINRRRQRSRGLFRLRPVTFRYRQDPQGIRQYGLIAEEVVNVFPELVTRGSDGAVESVQYHELVPMLLNELQRQQRELGELRAQNRRLRATLVEQTAALDH